MRKLPKVPARDEVVWPLMATHTPFIESRSHLAVEPAAELEQAEDGRELRDDKKRDDDGVPGGFPHGASVDGR